MKKSATLPVVNGEVLEAIRAFLGERASIISEFDRHLISIPEREMRDEILRILERRPLSLTDLSKGMGIPQRELEQQLRPLMEEGRITARSFGYSIYYEILKI